MKKENILLLIAITMFVCAYVSFLIFLIGEINYIREHPCIETRTEERCFTHQKCVGVSWHLASVLLKTKLFVAKKLIA